MIAHGLMKNVKSRFKVSEIIKSLEKFKTNHISEFEKATQEYNKVLKQRIQRALKEVESGKSIQVNYNFDLTTPVNKTRHYDGLINLFSESQQTEIELTMAEADGIFNDNWDWIRSAKHTNSLYARGSETFYMEANTGFNPTLISSEDND